MKNTKKHLTIRIDEEFLKKYHYVCDYDGRSANAQTLQLMREYIRNFEKEHGKIDFTKEKDF